MKRSDIFMGYVRTRAPVLALIALFFAIMFTVYHFYRISLSPACYTLIIMLLALGIFAVFDVRKYTKDIKKLRAIRDMASSYIPELEKSGDAKIDLCFETINALGKKYQQLADNARDEAEKTNRYYTLWSHQAKTPLSAMRLLINEEEPDIPLLQQELFKVEQYVDMALQYQRLRSCSNDLSLAECNIESIVKKAVKRTSTLFIAKKIGLVLGEIKISAISDEKWLLFVLEQIITNAVKYTNSGSVSIYSEGNILCIKDTGIGISSEDLPRIFDWGYTGQSGRSNSRSTGIGLSLCKDALDMLGHPISISSNPGKGTLVKIDLSRHRFEIE